MELKEVEKGWFEDKFDAIAEWVILKLLEL